MNKKLGVIMMLLTATMWSFSGVCVKLMTWNSWAIACGRGSICAIVLIIYLRKLPKFPRNIYHLLAMLSYVGMAMTLVAAYKLTTSANAVLLQYTAPVYSAILAYFVLGERVQKKDIVTIALVLAGLAIFLYDGLTAGRMLGNLFGILSGVCFAGTNVFMKKCDDDVSPAANVFWGNIIMVLISLPFMGKPDMTSLNISVVVFLGVVQLGLAYIFYSIGIRHVTALEATFITAIEPVLNPVWVMLILKSEKPGITTVVGGVLVIGAILWRELSDKHQKEKECPPQAPAA